jgi:DNA-binding NarL/FixJ family response regulator
MSSAARPRVLLADDYPGMVVAIKRLLATDCEIIGTVTDGQALLEAAARLHLDVVVADLHLPHVNGLEACRRIRRANPQIKVIVLSGLSEEDVCEAVLAAGASAFVAKSVMTEELMPAIAMACAGSAR